MEYYLYHHGILGQRWGKRNGPPYPLDSKEHSASERKAGWRRSLDKGSDETYNKDRNKSEKKHLSEGQKRAIKIGIAAAASALAAYGTYKLVKSGKLDNVINAGKEKLNSLFKTEVEHKRFGELLAGNADHIFNTEKNSEPTGKNTFSKTIQQAVSHGFKVLSKPETNAETIMNANPFLGTSDGKNNCAACAFAVSLRRQGLDVTAKSTGGEMQNLAGMVEECFKNPYIIEGSAVKFGRSRNDAAEMLVKKFGNDAEGAVSVQWKGFEGCGHVFNWKIENGRVTFDDGQQKMDDGRVSMRYWSLIDPMGALQIARLDRDRDGNELEKDWDALKNYVG